MQDRRMGFEDEDLPREAARPCLGQAALFVKPNMTTKMDPNHYTSYTKVIRGWMQLIFFIRKLRKMQVTKEDHPSLWEEAQTRVILYTQKQYFQGELKQLRKSGSVPATSNLSKR